MLRERDKIGEDDCGSWNLCGRWQLDGVGEEGRFRIGQTTSQIRERRKQDLYGGLRVLLTDRDKLLMTVGGVTTLAAKRRC
ncbi:hypothetical protein K1719_024182 [Acacia pycnantha]|nr:hypothetical protein K1719_024182 [Acacia pycnantha]